MRIKTIFLASTLLALTLAANGNLRAAIVTESFFLNQSNALPNGVNYATVKLTADDSAGTVNFEVSAPYVYSGSAGSHYGFDKFFFNTNGLVLTTDFAIVYPSHWSYGNGSFGASEFGNYDVMLTADRGIDSKTPLVFAVQMNAGKESSATIANFANLHGSSSPNPPLN